MSTGNTHPQEDELESLRNDLRRQLSYIRGEHPNLWMAGQLFLQETADHPTGSIESFVESELSALQQHGDNQQYEMYDHRRVDDAEEAFPDRCADCEHYGTACPMLSMGHVIERRERIYETSDSPAETQRRLGDLANDHGCHVLTDVLQQYTEGVGAMVKTGHKLHRQVEAAAGRVDASSFDADTAREMGVDLDALGVDEEDIDNLDVEPDAGVKQRPPGEDQQRVAETINEALSDDEEDED